MRCRCLHPRNGIHFLHQLLSDDEGAAGLLVSADLYYETYRRGVYSPRPYHLALIPDASVLCCVLALAISCCKAWNLDAAVLIRSADPSARVSDADLLAIKDFARWQNTVFPGTWNTPAIEALGPALDDIGCGALAAAIVEHTVNARGY